MTLLTHAGPQAGDKVLSIRQPWLHLILRGFKHFENRSKPTNHRGRLWLHASQSLALKSWSDLADWPHDGIELPALTSLPCGVILGSVEVYDSRLWWDMDEADQNDPFAQGPHCWYLRDPQPLAQPIAAKGALGIWTFRQ